VIILGIETATEQVGCALGGVEGLLSSFHAAHGRRHAEVLVPAIDFVCRSVDIELREVSVIAVDVGPGLFTGLRVGIATAKSMAQALRVPMIGLSSLDLLAHQVRYCKKLIVPVIDAKRNEVFSAMYRHVPGGVQRIRDYRVGSVRELADELASRAEDALLVGDGAIRYSAELGGDHGMVEMGGLGVAYPSAVDLVELAHPRALREEFVQPRELEPLYLRKADAELRWEGKASA